MIFTIGDLILLLVVGTVLAVYRYLDRNNRSLEKVKRYTDKVKDDLDGFIEGKSEELKNLSIELDVHQKTAKEVLKRIGGTHEELRKRTSAIEEIQKRITEYDQALSDLTSMTQKVDENLSRLHEESEFVDTVGRRVKDAMGLMAQIEKTIPNLKDDFARQNADQLKTLSTEVTKACGEMVDSIAEELSRSENLVREFSDHIDQLQTRRDSMEEETVNNVRLQLQEFSQDADDSKSRLLVQFEQEIKALLEREEDAGKNLLAEIEDRHGELKGAVSETEETISEKLETFQDRIDRIEEDFQSSLKDVAERGRSLEDEVFNSLKDHIETRARNLESSLIGVLEETKEGLEKSRKELIEVFGETRSEVTIWRAEIQKRQDDSINEITDRYDRFSSEIDVKLRDALSESGRTQAEQQGQLEEFIELTKTEIESLENGIKQRVHGLEEEIEVREVRFRQQMSEAEERSYELASSVQHRMEGQIESFSSEFGDKIGDIEKKVSEYEEDVAYRFGRVEEVNTDIDALETNLRTAMERITGKIRGEFEVEINQIDTEREAEKTKAEAQLQEIRDSMRGIEAELNELKAKAYENVSEKLKVFEDDFFTDLQTRNLEMQEKLESWQTEINQSLVDLSASHNSEREGIEQSYDEELKKKLAEVQSSTYTQYERFDHQVSSFESSLVERMGVAESSLKELEGELKGEIDEAKRSSNDHFSKQFGDFSGGIDAKIKQREHDVETSLKSLGNQMEQGKAEVMAILEAANSDVTVWQARVLQQLKAAEGESTEQVERLQGEIRGNIDTLALEFKTQREEIVENTQEERRKLREELDQIVDAVNELEGDLKRRSRESLEQMEQSSERALQDFHQRSRDLQLEIDEALRGFRTSAQETRERVDGIQKKLSVRIEENTRLLSVNLQEIDKKQKSFVNQTKIFERADSLKTTLQDSIEVLKAEIGSVEEQTSALRIAERDFGKIRKLGEEVSGKLSKFLSEKRRIEEMESDFKRLLSISQSVDMRLEQVTASHDSLQEVQTRIRSLEDLSKEAAQKFDRLDNKKQIVDATTESVDRNFELLEKLQYELDGFEKTLSPMSEQLEEVRERMEILAENREKTDRVVASLDKVDGILAELENRMDKLQNAREWLAGTETRLQEITSHAQEQIKIAGNLLSNETGPDRKQGGSGQMGRKDMVAKLAHQGWTVDQIARATELSRGEVELMLELIPKR